jgi:hypothetical protein
MRAGRVEIAELDLGFEPGLVAVDGAFQVVGLEPEVQPGS